MQQNKLTLLGMSGVGKTHLATLLKKEDNWYHYSGDYRIGSYYLNADILQDVKNYMLGDEYLARLLNNNAIKIDTTISFDNLNSVAHFLGKIGNPNLGGLPLKEFIRRQNLHLEAEKKAMFDVEKFIEKAKNQGFDNFINDAGGSLCELENDKIYQKLAESTLIVYIKASEKTKREVIKRAETDPKPLYYNPDFLEKQLEIYKKKQGFDYAAQINPDDFVRWVFPHLLKYREPKYQNIADKYGITILADDMYQCKNSADFFDLIKNEADNKKGKKCQ
jgi:shikimate kinase